MAKISWETKEELEKIKKDLEKLKSLPNIDERVSAIESVILSLMLEK